MSVVNGLGGSRGGAGGVHTNDLFFLFFCRAPGQPY